MEEIQAIDSVLKVTRTRPNRIEVIVEYPGGMVPNDVQKYCQNRDLECQIVARFAKCDLVYVFRDGHVDRPIREAPLGDYRTPQR